MKVARVQRHSRPPTQQRGQGQHALGTGIPPALRFLRPCLLSRRMLARWCFPPFAGHREANVLQEGSACALCPTPQPLTRAWGPCLTSRTHENKHHQELCKIALPPPSSGKVKFHAKAILLLFNYQPAARMQSSLDRFPFVWMHKAREPGLWGGTLRSRDLGTQSWYHMG